VSTSSKPGGSTYATGGFGSSSHLAVALFSFISGAKFNHVSYKGAGPALTDVVAAHIDFTVATLPGAIQQVRSSGLRALGISSLTRSPELPTCRPSPRPDRMVTNMSHGSASSLPGQLGPSWLLASGPCCAKPLIQPTPAIGCASKASSRKFGSRINFAKR
jgi:hypothetical protein